MRDALGAPTTVGRRGGALSARALGWFPVVGAALGAVLGGWWWLADGGGPRAWPRCSSSWPTSRSPACCTWTASRTRPTACCPTRRSNGGSRSWARPDVGAFGVVAVGAVLLLRVSRVRVDGRLDRARRRVVVRVAVAGRVGAGARAVRRARSASRRTLLAGAQRGPQLAIVSALVRPPPSTALRPRRPCSRRRWPVSVSSRWPGSASAASPVMCWAPRSSSPRRWGSSVAAAKW